VRRTCYRSRSIYDESSGILVDPTSVTLDITYGNEIGFVSDTAGPYTYSGPDSTPAAGTIWRTGTGQFTAWWQVPSSTPAGIYVANWSVGYSGDTFLVVENFDVSSVFTPVVSADTGYWTGSISCQPSWSASAFTIPLGGVDSNGTAWMLQKVEGWDSPPTAVGQVIQRSADHGGWAAAQYYGPRMITLTVMASAPTQALRDVARAQLQQAVPFSDLGTFIYNEPVPKLAYVRRNATSTIGETYPTLCDVIFSIPLVAPDPRKYAVAAQTESSVTNTIVTPTTLPSSGSPAAWLPVTFAAGVPPGTQGVIAVNSGTFETRPTITVQGPITSPSVINGSTGQAVTFTGLVLTASDTLVLSMDSRQAFKDGVFVPADSSSAWFVIEPGTSVIYMTGTGAAGSVLSMTWASAYV
jgi:hypothetical protein